MMRSHFTLRAWLRRTERFWDFLLGRLNSLSHKRTRRPLAVEALEDRVVPAGRPLPYPVIAVGPGSGPGLVKMYDAENGAPLLNLIPYETSFRGGIQVAVGDLTHDAYPDVVTAPGIGGGPHVRVYDGKTGQQVPGPLGSFFAYTPDFRGGVQVTTGDVTGDGWVDLITAADAGGGPHVKVFDGKSGDVVQNFFAFEVGFLGGVRVASKDLTGDKVAELILSAGAGGAPRVRVLDARTLEPIAGPLGDFYAFDRNQRGGVWVGGGDVNGDERYDLVAGSGVGARPEARVFDGRTGEVVFSTEVFDAGYRGGVRVATAWVNDDEYADVVIGSVTGMQPRVRTLDGRTGTQLAGPVGDFDPGVGSAVGGVSVAADNDPTIISLNVIQSTRSLAVGVPMAVTIEGTYSPYALTAKYEVDWQDKSTSSSKVTYSPPATSGSATFKHTYTSAVETTPVAVITAEDEEFGSTEKSPPFKLAFQSTPANFLTGPATDPVRQAPAGSDGNVPDLRSETGVRYRDGAITVVGGDLAAGGFGGEWGQDRSWSNDPSYAVGASQGNGWVNERQPLIYKSGSSLILLSSAGTASYYDGQGSPDGGGNYSTYLGRHTDVSGLSYDSTNDEFVLDRGDGTKFRFVGFGGSGSGLGGTLKSRTEPGGTTTSGYTLDALGRADDVRRSETVGGSTVTESYLHEYLGGSNANAGSLWKVTLRRQVGTGSWTTVRKVEYEYYTPSESHGNTGDLKRVTVTDGTTVLEQTYYRYYTSSSSPGYTGGLKYQLGPAAYAQLKAAVGGTDAAVDTASDSTLSPYADRYLEYDSSKRVTKVTASAAGCSLCTGGQGTLTYSYTTSSNSDGYNSWKMKTVETLPDGNTNTVYTNAYGEIMLKVYEETATGTKWRTFYRYDSVGRLILTANPSAVTGHNDTYADLMNYVSSNAQYLADSAGLVTVVAYYSSTTATDTSAGGAAGFQESIAIRQGETGTDVPQAAWTYFRKTAGGATATPVAAQTEYRNTNGTGGQATSYAYTWHSGTSLPASITTTLPTVTTAQNGPNAATTSTVTFDANGRPVWMKDGGGFISYVEYDAPTGGVTKTIADVNTATTSDFTGLPSGWSTPSGGGLHLKTTSEVDALGRATKVTDPLGHVTYIVFDDDNFEQRIYRGWDASTNLPTGPTQVIRADRAGRYTEILTMSATPNVTSNRPTGTESIGSLQSLSRAYRNEAGQTVHTDAYFNLSGLTYSTSTSLGTSGTHFYRTQQAYTHGGWPNRTITPAGTITRLVYDGLGRVVSEWVGTDDTPTTGFWSPTNLTGTNTVKVREYEYDGGGVGDGNRTKSTEIPGLSAANRVTQSWFDWRNRAVLMKAGVEGSESTSLNRPISYAEYDNLGQSIVAERYDGDAVTVTTTSGVPDRPSSSLLRAKSTAEFDELGRVFRTKTYSVDPSSGSVSSDALTTNSWFDARGLVLKTSEPGGLVRKSVFDGVGRATTVYTTDGGGDSGYSDADDVSGDIVLSQSESTFDANGNVLMTTIRDRFHDETGTGALGTASTGVKARVSYSTGYYDLGERLTDSVNVGTNGGSAYTRPSTVPSRSDTALVTSSVYDSAGRLWKSTDPRAIESRKEYDALGRTTKTIENYVNGTVSDDDDKTTEYAYGPTGMTSLTAKLTGGGGQTTEWVYGVTTSASGLHSNDIVGVTKWPDPLTGSASSSEQETVTVNALGQTATSTDRNGNVHMLSYDVLGRITTDAVTTLGSGVDGAVRRIETAYDTQGNAYLFSNYDAASGGSIVNQVKQEFNGLGQLTSKWQEHSGAVTGSSLRVQYAYTLMVGGANHSRQSSVAYPNGRVLTCNYSSGLSDSISRFSSLSDSSGTLESYDYLGMTTVVRRGHSQPGVDLSYVKQSGESNGDAGDQYAGLDRFGRVVDQRWIKISDGSHTDRFQYGYDRNGNRTYRDNLVNTAFGEVYTYDGLDQISTFKRGTLNSGKTDVTGSPSRTQSWDYDALGNWDSLTTDGTAQNRTHNKQNEISTVSGATNPTFDTNGNMTTDETGKQYVYDAWNRLKVVKNNGGSTLETMTYDAQHARVMVTDSGTTTNMYYSAAWQLLEEQIGGVAKSQYVVSPVFVDALILREMDSDSNGSLDQQSWVQLDANWNVTALLSNSGTAQERYTFDPFGMSQVRDAAWAIQSSSSLVWLHRHQSARLDLTSGLYTLRYRDVSPALGHWMQVDPVGFAGGDANLYRHLANDPVNSIDPNGLSRIKQCYELTLTGMGVGAMNGFIWGGGTGLAIAIWGGPLNGTVGGGVGAISGAVNGAYLGGSMVAMRCMIGGYGAPDPVTGGATITQANSILADPYIKWATRATGVVAGIISGVGSYLLPP